MTWERELIRLRIAVSALPDPRRSVYLLSARDQLDYSAIGARLGLNVPEVERQLAAALLDLIHALDGDADMQPSGN